MPIIKPPAEFTPRNDAYREYERLVTLDPDGFSYELLRELSPFKRPTKALQDGLIKSLSEMLGTMIVRYFRAGQNICVQDYPGFTAFYILEKNEIQSLCARGKLKEISFKGWKDEAVASATRRFYDKPGHPSDPDPLAEGEIFGEMSCLYKVPRTATVEAKTECYILEFMQHVFKKCEFEKRLSMAMIRRILKLHLRTYPPFTPPLKDKRTVSSGLSQEIYDRFTLDIAQTIGLPSKAEEDALEKEKEQEEKELEGKMLDKAEQAKWDQARIKQDQQENQKKEAVKKKWGKILQERRHNAFLIDEHDRPDGLYIIRFGLVKIIGNISALLGKSTVKDWDRLFASLATGAAAPEGPLGNLWLQFTSVVDRANVGILDKVKGGAGALLSEHEQQELLYGLNDLLKRKDFCALIRSETQSDQPRPAAKAPASPVVSNELESLDYDDVLGLRVANRRLLEELLGDALHPYGVKPAVTLAYRAAREWVLPSKSKPEDLADAPVVGKIGLTEGAPRSATCIAFTHPEQRSKTDTKVQLFYFERESILRLLQESNQPDVFKRIAEARKAETHFVQKMPEWRSGSDSESFDEMALIQGQKLMLIDLDRCTRCDKCVEACVESHTKHWWTGLPFTCNTGPLDGRNRLFLDGSRIQLHDGEQVKNYLVPATCRQCREPVCLTNCPVGSIHKGANGQIVIENWCIGCSACSKNCPYNSIQMHSLGVIPQSSFGWQYALSNGTTVEDRTPFRVTSTFRDLWQKNGSVDFVYRFNVTSELIQKHGEFRLEIVSKKLKGLEISAQINHESQIQLHENKALLAWVKDPKPRNHKKESDPQKLLLQGRNTLKITVALVKGQAADDLKLGAEFLDACLIGFTEPQIDPKVLERIHASGDSEEKEEYMQDWIELKAVVCDMCSGQAGQKPACVTACPHEAAGRYDALQLQKRSSATSPE